MRYRQYLKDRESQIRGMMMENVKAKKQNALEDKRYKERVAMEDKKEEARRKAQVENERIGDERQAAALSATQKNLEKSLSASEKRARIHEAGSDRRLNKREEAIEGRLDKKLSGEGKKKLITIYSTDGRTKMVPVATDQEYEPPEGWSTEKPSKEEKMMQNLLKSAPPAPPAKPSVWDRLTGKSNKKIPVYSIGGKLLRYE